MAKQETIADIIAEKRRQADKIERNVAEKMKRNAMISDCYARELVADIRQEADRLEAAHKREVQDALDTGGYVEASRRAKQSGDGAKLREALCFLIENEHTLFWADLSNGELELLQQIVGKARAALASPARNCDRFNTGDPVKDAEDAYCAWQQYCDDPSIPPSCKVESAFKDWLFAPATEKEGGGK